VRVRGLIPELSALGPSSPPANKRGGGGWVARECGCGELGYSEYWRTGCMLPPMSSRRLRVSDMFDRHCNVKRPSAPCFSLQGFQKGKRARDGSLTCSCRMMLGRNSPRTTA
jgi:hypothetical protein